MTSAPSRRRLSFGTMLLLTLLLLLAAAAATVWALARWPGAARFLGVAEPGALAAPPAPAMSLAVQPQASALPSADAVRLAALEGRLARVESATQRAEGSAGRADALLVAFAARRAIDRGVALGYLEPLLVERFSATHPRAVATVVTASRNPVTLDQLTADFDALEPVLKGGAPNEGVWDGVRRELGSLVSIRRADRPSPRPNATYDRAQARLAAGQVDLALTEAMRLPGIARAGGWVRRARIYVAAHRSLDEVESAALLAGAN
ncbi:hypothetical protein ACFQPG_02390 [Sphingomonas sp. GCM10030256]|uniref:hypothetical protein n=1 Tax=Sphingomonas sp. GCM10030256 TaxID=3273427 RepID=UPI003615E6EF